jgi:hypothetical protein
VDTEKSSAFFRRTDHPEVLAGDPFAYAGRGPSTETDLLTAIREEQANIGRHMTDSELDKFAREYYAHEYRRDLRRIMAMGTEEPADEL